MKPSINIGIIKAKDMRISGRQTRNNGMQISIPTASQVHLAQTGNCFPFQKKDLSGLQWHPNTIGIHLFVNYPPLARAEVGAFGLRPSFFLPILHRQAPVFHRLFLICRIFSEKSNFMRIFFTKKMDFISLPIEEGVFFL